MSTHAAEERMPRAFEHESGNGEMRAIAVLEPVGQDLRLSRTRRSRPTRSTAAHVRALTRAATYRHRMLRPGNWTKPAGASPVRVIAGEPGSRPRFVVERRRAERGVESLFGGSKRAGRSATRRESCSLVKCTMGEPSRSFHGEGPCPTSWPVPETPLVGSPRGTWIGTHARFGSGQERPVWPASSAKTVGISQW